MFRVFIMVGVGGAAGSMLRYAIGLFFQRYFQPSFPFSTLFINLLGCLLIGFLFGLADKQAWMQGNVLLLLATGFCGGFTTFSTFALENIGLIQQAQFFSATFYSLLSVGLGLALCRLGMFIANATF
ncbi:MAG: fluoride efflux transporter CrcB [Bacteroidetes bacterium]|nr:fluoride efflux transporter CrcB [Bacteroidota bacterium]MBS1739838.1 fluoride efflux transporter CrcB [Bacteroidota bacterium]